MQTSTETTKSIRPGRIACGLIVLVCLAELFAQAYFLHWAGRRYESVRVNKWSPYGLVRNNPELTSPGYFINSHGFRGKVEYSKIKPPKTLRVMILGASVMYSGLGGWFPPDTKRVTAEETISEYLVQQLRNDPELAGINIEVINAAVNFNRVNEITCGYLDEYQFWDPDILIIGASANTFPIEPPLASSLTSKNYNIQGWHPWRFEFERQANDYRPLPLFERTYSTLEESSAAAALVRKFTTKASDAATSLSQRLGGKFKGYFAGRTAPSESSSAPATAASVSNSFASIAEYDQYIDDVLGFLKAIQTCAKGKNQSVYFFWEYYLVQLNGLKPFTEAEQRLYEGNLRVRPLVAEATYNFRARDRLSTELEASGSMLIDPLVPLKDCHDSVFIDYIHYTPAGNRFMAQVMYDSIRAQALKVAASLQSASTASATAN